MKNEVSDKLQFVAAAQQEYAGRRSDKLKFVEQLSSWWRAILGTLLVLAGLATAMLTLFARRLGAPELASAGAIASLVFVLLIVVLVVPPLARSAFAEVSG